MWTTTKGHMIRKSVTVSWELLCGGNGAGKLRELGNCGSVLQNFWTCHRNTMSGVRENSTDWWIKSWMGSHGKSWSWSMSNPAVVLGAVCGTRRHHKLAAFSSLPAVRPEQPDWRCGCCCCSVPLCSSSVEPAPCIQEPGTSGMCHAGFCQWKLSVVGSSYGTVWVMSASSSAFSKLVPARSVLGPGELQLAFYCKWRWMAWGGQAQGVLLEEAVSYPVDSTVGKGSFSQLSQPCFFFRTG